MKSGYYLVNLHGYDVLEIVLLEDTFGNGNQFYTIGSEYPYKEEDFLLEKYKNKIICGPFQIEDLLTKFPKYEISSS